MTLTLFAHPFSSYCQKVLIALYENDTPFAYRQLGPEDPGAFEDLKALWPPAQFPVLVDAGAPVIEASIIVEHLALHHPGPVRLLPEEPRAALEARFLDRFFDNHVAPHQQKIVADALRPEGRRDPFGVEGARAALDTAYAWLDRRMDGRRWAAGEAFGFADCAAAPQLFYADWTHPMNGRFPNVAAYRERLLARPSFARCVEEARPFRPLFPLGAPDRD